MEKEKDVLALLAEATRKGEAERHENLARTNALIKEKDIAHLKRFVMDGLPEKFRKARARGVDTFPLLAFGGPNVGRVDHVTERVAHDIRDFLRTIPGVIARIEETERDPAGWWTKYSLVVDISAY